MMGITSGGYGMRNMNLVWDRRNSMSLVGRSHGGVVYIIKIKIPVRITSRNSKGSMSLM